MLNAVNGIVVSKNKPRSNVSKRNSTVYNYFKENGGSLKTALKIAVSAVVLKNTTDMVYESIGNLGGVNADSRPVANITFLERYVFQKRDGYWHSYHENSCDRHWIGISTSHDEFDQSYQELIGNNPIDCDDIKNLNRSINTLNNQLDIIYAYETSSSVSRSLVECIRRSKYGSEVAKDMVDSRTNSCLPTMSPTLVPTNIPTYNPSFSPTMNPIQLPTVSPTLNTNSPTETPSTFPTKKPTNNPFSNPTGTPSTSLTTVPSDTPTNLPSTFLTYSPTVEPSKSTTAPPTVSPTSSPTEFIHSKFLPMIIESFLGVAICTLVGTLCCVSKRMSSRSKDSRIHGKFKGIQIKDDVIELGIMNNNNEDVNLEASGQYLDTESNNNEDANPFTSIVRETDNSMTVL